jgi:hypothetical protein
VEHVALDPVGVGALLNTTPVDIVVDQSVLPDQLRTTIAQH